MGQPGVDESVVAMLTEIRPHLDERQWRLLLGAQARELERGIEPDGRVRRAGAGRPAATRTDPTLVTAVRALVDPETRGDPESPLRWTTKSTANLADALTAAGHRVSPDTVGRLLKADGFSLQGNAKTVEGAQHPDRDGQFRHINELVSAFQGAGEPVISVDSKKKLRHEVARSE